MTVARVRHGGMSDFTIGLVCGENRCAVLLDGWGGTVSGISHIDGKVAINNETKTAGGIFPLGRPAAIVVTVRHRSILVTVNGKTIVNWRGDPARLSVVPPSPPGSRMLTIGAFGGYFRVDKLTLTPLPDSSMPKAK
jgi:serine protease Do